MQIVIDIPEKVKQAFDNAKNEDLYGNYYDYNSLIGIAIKNGIQLSKGHGRLIDVSEYFKKEFGDAREFLDKATTIIEADTPKRRKGTPLEENDSGYNCENWIP